MRRSFHLIAYEALDVCNAVQMATLDAAIALTRLEPGRRALDLGAGNGAVAIQLARRWGFEVEAVELDPAMADLARARALASDAPIVVTTGPSAEVLARAAPMDLIVALGATNVVGLGRVSPRTTFEALKPRLAPDGWLLWGDLTWIAEPTEPVRQMAEAANLYADAPGWRSAAEAAGFQVVWDWLSPRTVWNAYAERTIGAASEWLEAHPDAPEAPTVRASRDRLAAFFHFAEPFARFGLYLLKAPA